MNFPKLLHLFCLAALCASPLRAASPPLIAIIDSGIDATHPFFDGWFLPVEDLTTPLPPPFKRPERGHWTGWDFIDADASPDDESGHGTHVAGVLLAALGTKPTDTSARLLVLRTGVVRHELFRVTEGVNAAIALKKAGVDLRIVLCAFEYERLAGDEDEFAAFEDAFTRLLDLDVIVVASAGNGGRVIARDDDSKPPFPAAFEHAGLFTATACGADGHLAARSNTGPSIVAVAVPGVAVEGPAPGGGTRVISGSSQAAAALAGWLMQGSLASTPPPDAAALRQKLAAAVKPHPSLTGSVALDGYLPPSLTTPPPPLLQESESAR